MDMNHKKSLLNIMLMPFDVILEHHKRVETIDELNEMLIRLCGFLGERSDSEVLAALKLVQARKAEIGNILIGNIEKELDSAP